jgi:hypothetical protein
MPAPPMLPPQQQQQLNCFCSPTMSSGPIPATLTITSPPYYPSTSTTSSTYPGPMGY